MVKKTLISRAVLLFVTAIFTAPGYTSENNQPWQVCARSDVKALRFITVGEATLSRHKCQTSNLQSPTMRLSFRYFREVPGDAFAKAALNFLEKNLSKADFERYKARFKQFNNHYQDIGDGDVYTLTYRPNSLTLALNNTLLATETGDDFARNYLRIWFGETPYSRPLKENLLQR